LLAQRDTALQTEGWVHLYGVSTAATLLAWHRGLDADLCAGAGLLHDIYTFRTGEEKDHARYGSLEAVDILRAAGGWAESDITTISAMISRHSDKAAVDGPQDECLKDADVFAHWLYDRDKKFDAVRKGRLEHIFSELGLQGTIQTKP
jgi:uncharacterized protein